MSDEDEQVLTGGCVNEVVRVGDTVRRSAGRWTPAVHALLLHLESAGFRYSPRVLGVDDAGREVLSFIEGTPASRPWPEVVRSDVGLRAIGLMLRELSEALADFEPPPGAVWRTEPVAGSVAMRHGDVGPWNSLWDGEELVGLIDWDFAEPAPPLWDIAQAAWYTIPIFGGAERSRECGFAREPDRAHRLRVLCAAYGAEPADVLDALADLQRVEQERLVRLAAAGEYPFTAFLARGDDEELTVERARLTSWRSALLAS